MKTYTAVVTIGNGTKEEGRFRTTVEVSAKTRASARKMAVNTALSSTDVTVELSEGSDLGAHLYREVLGKNPEPW
jgi:hypothetical protein